VQTADTCRWAWDFNVEAEVRIESERSLPAFNSGEHFLVAMRDIPYGRDRDGKL